MGRMADKPTGKPIFARCYARMSRAMEENGMAANRRRLLSGLDGEVIEVGAGNGLNFAHYPAEVKRVLAVEPEGHLRGLAEREARNAAVPVEVTDGHAGRLPAEDDAFDAVVFSLVLCSVPDQRRALAEAGRVLRPGGRLHFFEHVRAETPGLRRVQRLVDATFWPHVSGGCRTARDSVAAIETAGFRIDSLERFRFPETRMALPTSPVVLGVAVAAEG